MATVLPRQSGFFESFLENMQQGQQMFFQNERLKQQKEALNLQKKRFEQEQLESQAAAKQQQDNMALLGQFMGGGQQQQPQAPAGPPPGGMFGQAPEGFGAQTAQPQQQEISPFEAIIAAQQIGPQVAKFVGGRIAEIENAEALAGASQVLDAIEAGNIEGISFADTVEALNIADVPDKRSNEILRATFPTPTEGVQDLVDDAVAQASLQFIGGMNIEDIMQSVQSGQISVLGMAALNKLGVLGSIGRLANTRSDNEKIITDSALGLQDELNLEHIPLHVFREIVLTGEVSEASQKRLSTVQLMQLGSVLEGRIETAVSSHASAVAALSSQVINNNETIEFNIEAAKRAIARGDAKIGNQLLEEASAAFDQATKGTGLPNTIPALVETAAPLFFQKDPVPRRVGFVSGDAAELARHMDKAGVSDLEEMEKVLVSSLQSLKKLTPPSEEVLAAMEQDRRLLNVLKAIRRGKVTQLKLEFDLPRLPRK